MHRTHEYVALVLDLFGIGSLLLFPYWFRFFYRNEVVFENDNFFSEHKTYVRSLLFRQLKTKMCT